MKLCIKYRLNPTGEQEQVLRDLGFYATKLYNTDNHIRRSVWDETGKIPNWYQQKKSLKTNHWYKLLPSQTAQATIKNLQDNYNSWFSLRREDPDARPPMFRKKNKLSPLTFYQQFKLDGDMLMLTMSRKYKAEKDISRLMFKVNKWRKIGGTPKMCNIIRHENKWMAHIVYEIPEVKLKKNPEVMAVDLGIINLATTVDTKGNTNIHSGGCALSVQHYFNKEIAKAQSNSDKQKVKSKKKRLMSSKKSKQIHQILHTVTKRIIDTAKTSNVGVIVVGDIKNIRRGRHWHNKSSQKLHSWGFAKLTQQLEYKAKLAGIRFMKVSERNTSKTCSVCEIVKKSNRKHRGLYKCKCGNIMNADINGAVNILKKYLRGNISRSIGVVATPVVWRNYNVVPK